LALLLGECQKGGKDMKYNIAKRTPTTLLDDFFNDDFFFPRTNYGSQIDVYQENNKYVVEVDLPGFKREEIDIQFNNDVLTVKADHKEEEINENKKYYYRSRKVNSFMRQIRFNGIDPALIGANFSEGVLKVELPIKETSEVVNRIEVK
jgi:HSP20 family protein